MHKGIESFLQKDFDNAMLNFSLAIEEQKDIKEARMGAILSDLARDKEDEAMALFEYYLISKENDVKDSEALVEEVIDAVEMSLEDIEGLFSQYEIEAKINEENGIPYEDFRTIIAEKNNFKEAFEDIMFSTKVIIHNKNDFLHFLEQLIDNGFTEMSLNYFETASKLYPNDQQLLSLIKKVNE